MTAMTIRMWTQFPVRGKLELMFRPKAPSSQSTTRTMMMIQSNDMRFLLLNELLNYIFDATWSIDRVTVDLTAQQDEDAGRDGDDRQDHAKAANTQKCYQAPGNEKNSQQDHTDISGDMHVCTPFFSE
jgi:hypothetical protein